MSHVPHDDELGQWAYLFWKECLRVDCEVNICLRSWKYLSHTCETDTTLTVDQTAIGQNSVGVESASCRFNGVTN